MYVSENSRWDYHSYIEKWHLSSQFSMTLSFLRGISSQVNEHCFIQARQDPSSLCLSSPAHRHFTHYCNYCRYLWLLHSTCSLDSTCSCFRTAKGIERGERSCLSLDEHLGELLHSSNMAMLTTNVHYIYPSYMASSMVVSQYFGVCQPRMDKQTGVALRSPTFRQKWIFWS